MTAAVANIVIAERKLRWSSPITFNDPFDITQELRLDFDVNTLKHIVEEKFSSMVEGTLECAYIRSSLLAKIMDMVKGLNIEQRKLMAIELRRCKKDPTIGQIDAHEMLKSEWSDIVKNFRILCLSELYDVTPMWQHYADAYKGVVLEFSAVDDLDSAFLVARPVIYRDEPPAIADPEVWAQCICGQTPLTYEDLFKEYEYRKTTDWSYEKEWRIVSYAKPGEGELYYDYRFNPRELAGVYFGINCSSADKADIEHLLSFGFEHVRCYSGHIDSRKGKIAFE